MVGLDGTETITVVKSKGDILSSGLQMWLALFRLIYDILVALLAEASSMSEYISWVRTGQTGLHYYMSSTYYFNFNFNLSFLLPPSYSCVTPCQPANTIHVLADRHAPNPVDHKHQRP
jgi:hypothetical protein